MSQLSDDLFSADQVVVVESDYCVITVSYTHLDVYKRQVECSCYCRCFSMWFASMRWFAKVDSVVEWSAFVCSMYLV